jgi:glutamate/aspartate transport system permease protein
MNLDLSFYSWDLVHDFVLKGLLFSVTLTVVAALGGTVLGTGLALLRRSERAWLRGLALFYVNGMRSVPLVMVILWFYLLVPFLIGRPIGAEWSAFITFTAFEAAYFSEIVRSGLQSVKPGQAQAAKALGLTEAQALRYVVLPQAFRNMVPVLLTQTIVLFQDTSLVYAIGAYDLLKGFESAGKNFGRPIEVYVMAALVYFVICFVLSRVVKAMTSERKMGFP